MLMILLLYLCKISQLLCRHAIYELSTPKRINLESLGIAATVPYSLYNTSDKASGSLDKKQL